MEFKVEYELYANKGFGESIQNDNQVTKYTRSKSPSKLQKTIKRWQINPKYNAKEGKWILDPYKSIVRVQQQAIIKHHVLDYLKSVLSIVNTRLVSS